MRKLMSATLVACTAMVLPMEGQEFAPMQPEPPPSPRGAYYSAQMPFLPPLPFNPFPYADIVEVEPERFVYDDMQVDYVSLRAWQMESQLDGGGMMMSM